LESRSMVNARVDHQDPTQNGRRQDRPRHLLVLACHLVYAYRDMRCHTAGTSCFAHNKPTTVRYTTPHTLYLSMKNGKVLQASYHNPAAEADQPFVWIFQACCSADATLGHSSVDGILPFMADSVM
jgi:hypothetical protein